MAIFPFTGAAKSLMANHVLYIIRIVPYTNSNLLLFLKAKWGKTWKIYSQNVFFSAEAKTKRSLQIMYVFSITLLFTKNNISLSALDANKRNV